MEREFFGMRMRRVVGAELWGGSLGGGRRGIP